MQRWVAARLGPCVRSVASRSHARNLRRAGVGWPRSTGACSFSCSVRRCSGWSASSPPTWCRTTRSPTTCSTRDAEQIGPSDENATPLGTSAARYTECTAFSLGLGARADANVLTNAMSSPAYTGCTRLDAALDTYAETGTLRAGFPYLRYWHGYAMITRPALALFGVTGTRWIAFACSLLVVFGMCAAVKRSFGLIATLFVVGPALLTSDMVVAGLYGEHGDRQRVRLARRVDRDGGGRRPAELGDRRPRRRRRRGDQRLPRPDDDDAGCAGADLGRGDTRRLRGRSCVAADLADSGGCRGGLDRGTGVDVGLEVGDRGNRARLRHRRRERPLADRVPGREREQRRHRLALRRPHRQHRDVVGPPAHAVGGARLRRHPRRVGTRELGQAQAAERAVGPRHLRTDRPRTCCCVVRGVEQPQPDPSAARVPVSTNRFRWCVRARVPRAARPQRACGSVHGHVVQPEPASKRLNLGVDGRSHRSREAHVLMDGVHSQHRS